MPQPGITRLVISSFQHINHLPPYLLRTILLRICHYLVIPPAGSLIVIRRNPPPQKTIRTTPLIRLLLNTTVIRYPSHPGRSLNNVPWLPLQHRV